MSDLHERLLAAVNERLELAKALPNHPGPWTVDEIHGGYVSDRNHGEIVAYDVPGDHLAPFIAANDPATVIRHCERDLKVLGRHAIIWRDIGWLETDDGEVVEEYDEIPVCGHCVPRHSHFRSRAEVPEGACAEITDLATAYNIDSALAAPQRLERGGSAPPS